MPLKCLNRLRIGKLAPKETRYDSGMNPPQDAEFAKFTNAMRDILKVSKIELQRRLEAEKKRPKGGK